ncbi:PASTA domain-containing protein, partial [Candidatus Margulisiibacteriota bacterium]
ALINNIIYSYTKGIPEASVPDVVNSPKEEAIKLLKSQGFKVKIAGKKYNKEIPEDYVIMQIPEPEKMVKRGRIVQLFLSSGTPDTLIENYRNMSLDDLREKLKKESLKVNVKEHRYHKTIPPQCIIEQNPAPNEAIGPDGIVEVVVSKGFPVNVKAKDQDEEVKMVRITFDVPAEWGPQIVNVRVTSISGKKTIYSGTINPAEKHPLQHIGSKEDILTITFDNQEAFSKKLSDI